MKRIAICLLLVSCSVAQFRNSTPADEAQCRNQARGVTGASRGRRFVDAYNDCMIGKGYSEIEQ